MRLSPLVVVLAFLASPVQAAQPLAWWLEWDVALAERIVAGAPFRLGAVEAAAALEQSARPAHGTASLAANATDVALAAPGATALSAAAAVRQLNSRPAQARDAVAGDAAFAAAAGVVLAANEAAGTATLQANAVAIHLAPTPGADRNTARTALDQQIAGSAVTAGSLAAAASMSGVLTGRVGVMVVNQSAGTLGNQANVTAIAQPATLR
ncbi:MAG: hypothetical protein AB7F67_16745 [Rhodospirillaceae bacterium]